MPSAKLLEQCNVIPKPGSFCTKNKHTLHKNSFLLMWEHAPTHQEIPLQQGENGTIPCYSPCPHVQGWYKWGLMSFPVQWSIICFPLRSPRFSPCRTLHLIRLGEAILLNSLCYHPHYKEQPPAALSVQSTGITAKLAAGTALESVTKATNMTLTQLQEAVEDRRAWRAPVHRVTKSQTRLND